MTTVGQWPDIRPVGLEGAPAAAAAAPAAGCATISQPRRGVGLHLSAGRGSHGADRRGSRPVRVLLADDAAFYRAGVARALAAHPGLDLIGEESDGPRALERIVGLRPDVAVVDMRMPRMDGLELCRRVRDRTPALPTQVVLISAWVDEEAIAAATRAGAAAYVGKHESRAALCRAVLAVDRLREP